MTTSSSPAPALLDAHEFLQKYWQKRPCLFRNVIPGFKNFITKEKLFALSCEDSVDSRLVLEKDGAYPWQVIHGPFESSQLKDLPSERWSILVQNLELHLPQAADFLSQFNFIPNWRVDDLMVSYASNHGSVGAHLDSYDVFLFQAGGRRQWSINLNEYDEDDFIDGLDLKIIEGFKTEQSWQLETGDMLYLPPGVAHHGIAINDSLTFSIGFRAPSRNELLSGFVDRLIEVDTDILFGDADRSVQEHPGEISSKDINRIIGMLAEPMKDQRTIVDWFGRHSTELPESYYSVPPKIQMDTNNFIEAFSNIAFFRKRSTRSTFTRTQENVLLFVNAECHEFPHELTFFVENFTATEEFANPLPEAPGYQDVLVRFLCQLYNSGHLVAAEK